MSTPKKVQIAGGATAQEDAYIGLVREIRFDTSRKELRAHDGVTPGGQRIMGYDGVLAAIQSFLFGENINILFLVDEVALANVTQTNSNTICVIRTQAVANDYTGVWTWVAGAKPTDRGNVVASNYTGYWVNVGGKGSFKGVATEVIGFTDFNAAIEDGWLRAANTVANPPLSVTAEWLVLNWSGTAKGAQLAIAMGTTGPEMYLRASTTGAYGAWFKIKTQGITSDAFAAVGSYMFAKNTTGGTIAPGGALAGASLLPADDSGATAGAAPAGTWTAMGAGTTVRSTLWVRTV